MLGAARARCKTVRCARAGALPRSGTFGDGAHGLDGRRM